VWFPGYCFAVCKMFWVVARVFACVKLTSIVLGCCVWLPGHCYAVAKVFCVVTRELWVVASELLRELLCLIVGLH